MSKIVSVKICDMSDDIVNEYTAYRAEDCNDEVDREVFNLVMEQNDQIMLGQVLGIPNYEK